MDFRLGILQAYFPCLILLFLSVEHFLYWMSFILPVLLVKFWLNKEIQLNFDLLNT